ncbi:MAG TPA: spondin domain-containing protein [Kofleriaceae bacterium]|nr:spondin domain-containing protein [Kofleriaceae bacterium]
MKSFLAMGLGLAMSVAVAGCDSDDGMDGVDPSTSDFRVRIENIAPFTVLKSGVVNTKTTGAVGALAAGEAFELTVTAGVGHSFSFASMLGESNDWFFAPGPGGIALYDGSGAPRSGDVTSEVLLWDAGTEVDEEPAVGGSTGPQQVVPDQGAPDDDPVVNALGASIGLADGSRFDLPAVEDMIKVTLTPRNDRAFVVRIENVSDEGTLETSQGARSIHVSPAVWALHIAGAPLFDDGAADRGEGLEYIAEAGRTATLASVMGELSGAATPLSPGVFAVASAGEPIYSIGLAERGNGLERIAEDGDPMVLAEAMMGAELGDRGIFNTPAGLDDPGPARPGAAFEITLSAAPGDRLAFATMFGMSNDWFFGTPAGGIELFDADGMPIAGDVTEQIAIYDAGTELDQELAIGADTGPQQAAPNTGRPDPVAQVRLLGAGDYPRPASAHMRVTVEPL